MTKWLNTITLDGMSVNKMTTIARIENEISVDNLTTGVMYEYSITMYILSVEKMTS